jgi:hypothetical protein
VASLEGMPQRKKGPQIPAVEFQTTSSKLLGVITNFLEERKQQATSMETRMLNMEDIPTVEDFLTKGGISNPGLVQQYAAILMHHGFDNPMAWSGLTSNLLCDLGFLPGHAVGVAKAASLINIKFV